MDYNNLQHHHLTSMCSFNTPEELEVIKTSIKETGLQVKITLYEGKILSGRARYQAYQELGLELTENNFEDKNFVSEDEAKQYVWDSNNARRHAKIEARLMDFMCNEEFLNKTGKPLKGDFRRKYISALLGHDCSENEVGVADRIYRRSHQDLIELYKSGKYPSTTCDLLAKQTDEYLDNLFGLFFDPNDLSEDFENNLDALKKTERENKRKAKISKALPTYNPKVLKDLQHAIEQVFPTGRFTLETVEETLLFLLKKGALKNVKAPVVEEVKAPVEEMNISTGGWDDEALDELFGDSNEELDSLSDTASVSPTTSEPKSEVTVEVNQSGAQTTNQAPKARKAAKTSPVDTVKKTASKSKTTKKLSSNTSRNRVKLTDVETRSPSPAPPTVKKRSNLRLS